MESRIKIGEVRTLVGRVPEEDAVACYLFCSKQDHSPAASGADDSLCVH